MSVVDGIRKLLTIRDERGEPTSAHFRMAARRIVRGMVTEHDCPVLDVAGREGLLFDPGVSPLARCTTVLDIEDAPLRDARRSWKGFGTFVCGDMTNLPFRDGAFGAVVCIGTIYNLREADTVKAGLAEMGRVTRPGGRIICEFRNARNLFMRFSSAFVRFYDRSFGNLSFHTYSFEEIGHLCREAGLDVVRIVPRVPPVKGLAMMFFLEATPSRREERRNA
jgi:ubiquinone/menaquinone biosynthesis C-methylase UbiE